MIGLTAPVSDSPIPGGKLMGEGEEKSLGHLSAHKKDIPRLRGYRERKGISERQKDKRPSQIKLTAIHRAKHMR